MAATSKVPGKSLILLEIRGLGRAGDPFGDHHGKRIFVEGAPKDAKWVAAELTYLKERFGSAKFIEAFQSLEEAKSKLEELRRRTKRAKGVKPEMPIKRPIERRMENVIFIGKNPP